MIIVIALCETERGTVRGSAGWVETDGVRYPVRWELGADDPLPDGITFAALLAAARAGRRLTVADDGVWTLESESAARMRP